MIAKDFLRDVHGATAIVFAFAIPVVIGAIAFAVDLGYYNVVRNQLQSAADAAALGATSLVNDETAAVAMALAIAAKNVPETFGEIVTATDVVLGTYDPATKTFVPSESNRNAAAVMASRDVEHANTTPRYFSSIWGDEAIAISAYAVAARTGQLTYQPPEITYLDPEAGDYNQIYVYCFDYEATGPKEERRSQMTLIADNEGADYDYIWPTCDDGEALSFRLHNVRHARAYPSLWEFPDRWPYRPEFNYYTDTVIVDGVEQFDIGWTVLETVRCDSLEECVGQSDGGVLPQGRHRTPNIEAERCEPSKFMYFGWEDRPPGQTGASATWTDPAWTDTDFDDIRIVMRCPEEGWLGDKIARLVR